MPMKAQDTTKVDDRGGLVWLVIIALGLWALSKRKAATTTDTTEAKLLEEAALDPYASIVGDTGATSGGGTATGSDGAASANGGTATGSGEAASSGGGAAAGNGATAGGGETGSYLFEALFDITNAKTGQPVPGAVITAGSVEELS